MRPSQMRLARYPGILFSFMMNAHLRVPLWDFTCDADDLWLLVQGPGLAIY